MWDADEGSFPEDADQVERQHLAWIADSAVAGLWDTAVHRGEPFPVFDGSDRRDAVDRAQAGPDPPAA